MVDIHPPPLRPRAICLVFNLLFDRPVSAKPRNKPDMGEPSVVGWGPISLRGTIAAAQDVCPGWLAPGRHITETVLKFEVKELWRYL